MVENTLKGILSVGFSYTSFSLKEYKVVLWRTIHRGLQAFKCRDRLVRNPSWIMLSESIDIPLLEEGFIFVLVLHCWGGIGEVVVLVGDRGTGCWARVVAAAKRNEYENVAKSEKLEKTNIS